MPPAPSMISEDKDEELSFQVINPDNLAMTIVGQHILQPFNKDIQKSKPNVIVHPTRRMANNIQEAIVKPSGNNNNNIFDGRIQKNGILYHTNSTNQMKLEDFKNQVDVQNFTKALDSKLKKLQKSEFKNLKPQKAPLLEQSASRKPFVTTVKKGKFLEPPPEIAFLMGIKIEDQTCVKKSPKEIKKLYAFASQPRILNRTPPRSVHQTRTMSKLYHPSDQKPSNYLPSVNDQPRWNPNCVFAKLLSRDEDELNFITKRSEQAERRALARRKARKQQIKCPKDNPIQSCYSVPNGLQQKVMELNQLNQLFIAKILADASTQTEMNTDLAEDPSYIEKLKTDAQIQVHPTDLFDFTTEVQPIVEILVSRTIEEALIEVLEEEELMAIKEQQRRFLEYMTSSTESDKVIENIKLNDVIFGNFSKRFYVPQLITSV